MCVCVCVCSVCECCVISINHSQDVPLSCSIKKSLTHGCTYSESRKHSTDGASTGAPVDGATNTFHMLAKALPLGYACGC